MLAYLSKKLNVILGSSLAIVLGLFGFYYYTTQNNIETLTTANTTLEQNNAIVVQKIDALNNTVRKYDNIRANDQQHITKLTKLQNNSRSAVIQLEKKLQHHRLSILSLSKPKIIEEKINNASFDLIKSLEMESDHASYD